MHTVSPVELQRLLAVAHSFLGWASEERQEGGKQPWLSFPTYCKGWAQPGGELSRDVQDGSVRERTRGSTAPH